MKTDAQNYLVGEYSMAGVRNRNGPQVVQAMRKAIASAEGFCGCQLCVEDVFAISMNQLPSHYVQSGSIVLGEKGPPDAEVEKIVTGAVERVGKAPNHD